MLNILSRPSTSISFLTNNKEIYKNKKKYDRQSMLKLNIKYRNMKCQYRVIFGLHIFT
jgi:hypothetical protein